MLFIVFGQLVEQMLPGASCLATLASLAPLS